MTGREPEPADDAVRQGITRRDAVRFIAVGGTLVLAPALLAGCYDDPTSVAGPDDESENRGDVSTAASEPFLSQIMIVSFNFPPKGWALCNGQLLPINQNQALFALLGTTFGGNGQTNFALPDFRGRIPIHIGNGHLAGEAFGSTGVTVGIQQLPAHHHRLTASNANGDNAAPAGNVLGAANSMYSVSQDRLYRPDDDEMIPMDAVPISPAAYGSSLSAGDLTTMAPGSVATVGGSQPHNNMMPFLGLSFIIALQGIFPSRN